MKIRALFDSAPLDCGTWEQPVFFLYHYHYHYHFSFFSPKFQGSRVSFLFPSFFFYFFF
jgi:hypothetical protein